MAIRNPEPKIMVGVSSCLLGDKVRWDGNHKQDSVVKNQLGRIFEWVPTCPEVEIGMGIPREAVQLAGSSKSPRMVGTESHKDWTQHMTRYANKRSRELAKLGVCGYIFKSRSPSCGIAHIPVTGKNGTTKNNGRGLFAGAFMQQCALIPAENEDRLHDARVRENFINRVFAYHRLSSLLNGRISRKALVEFHTTHKYLLMAHSRKHEAALGQLMGRSKSLPASQLKTRYAKDFMTTLTFKTTVKKNTVVLIHLLRILKDFLSEAEKKNLTQSIDNYRKESIQLTKPITLIQRHARKHKVDYLADQIYLLHPKELILRNPV
jgi:uncharacterized protein YbbK (DUF523 family)/uncharacterized protein YbgA (DUF1722 family)